MPQIIAKIAIPNPSGLDHYEYKEAIIASLKSLSKDKDFLNFSSDYYNTTLLFQEFYLDIREEDKPLLSSTDKIIIPNLGRTYTKKAPNMILSWGERPQHISKETPFDLPESLWLNLAKKEKEGRTEDGVEVTYKITLDENQSFFEGHNTYFVTKGTYTHQVFYMSSDWGDSKYGGHFE